MKVLIDECCHKKLKSLLTLPDIECKTVREIGYAGKKNGDLISLIDGVYDVLVTLDGSIRDQQNIQGRRLSILRIRAKSSDIKQHRSVYSRNHFRPTRHQARRIPGSGQNSCSLELLPLHQLELKLANFSRLQAILRNALSMCA